MWLAEAPKEIFELWLAAVNYTIDGALIATCKPFYYTTDRAVGSRTAIRRQKKYCVLWSLRNLLSFYILNGTLNISSCYSIVR